MLSKRYPLLKRLSVNGATTTANVVKQLWNNDKHQATAASLRYGLEEVYDFCSNKDHTCTSLPSRFNSVAAGRRSELGHLSTATTKSCLGYGRLKESSVEFLMRDNERRERHRCCTNAQSMLRFKSLLQNTSSVCTNKSPHNDCRLSSQKRYNRFLSQTVPPQTFSPSNLIQSDVATSHLYHNFNISDNQSAVDHHGPKELPHTNDIDNYIETKKNSDCNKVQSYGKEGGDIGTTFPLSLSNGNSFKKSFSGRIFNSNLNSLAKSGISDGMMINDNYINGSININCNNSHSFSTLSSPPPTDSDDAGESSSKLHQKDYNSYEQRHSDLQQNTDLQSSKLGSNLEDPLSSPDLASTHDETSDPSKSLPSSDSELSSLTPAPPLEKLLVIIDLDETLFFSHLNSQIPHDFSINVDGQNIYVSLRPGWKPFIEWCAANFEVGIYTAGTEEYCHKLMEYIDSHDVLFPISNRLYRQSCWPVDYEVQIKQKSVVQTIYTKDLSLYRKDLSRVVLLDNSLFSFMLQPDNGIPIADWRGKVEEENLGGAGAKDNKTNDDGSDGITRGGSSGSIVEEGGPGGKESEIYILDDERPKDEVGSSMVEESSGNIEKTSTQIRQGDSKESADGSSDRSTTGRDHVKGAGVDVTHNELNKENNNNDGYGESIKESEGSLDHTSTISGNDYAPDPHTDNDNMNNKIDSDDSSDIQIYHDFLPIKRTLEDLEGEPDVRKYLRNKYRVVDQVVRRCISGMIISSRL